MGVLALLDHLLNFLAPALAVGSALALLARWLRLERVPARRWWLAALLNSGAGLAALAGGLWVFGTDGKMATYAALVLAVATAQWVGGRNWRS